MQNFKKSLNSKIIFLIVAAVFLWDSGVYARALSGTTSLRVPLLDKERIEKTEDRLIKKDGDFYYSRSLDRAKAGDLLGEASDLLKARRLGSKQAPNEDDIIIKFAAALVGLRFCKYPRFRGWFLPELLKKTGASSSKAYLSEIADEEGLLKDRDSVEKLFNEIALLWPLFYVGSSDTTTRLNRYSDQFNYFERHIIPSVIKDKAGGDKKISIKSIGPATGEEMASIYFYLKRAFQSHPEWGDMEAWDIKIEGIDVSGYSLEGSERRLLHEPSELTPDFFSFETSEAMVASIENIEPEKRRDIFKITKGNIAYKPRRDEFLKDADVIFVNTLLHQVLTASAVGIVEDILNSDAAILTTHEVFYEVAREPRDAMEILEKKETDSSFYISSPGKPCIQEDTDWPLNFYEYQLFDAPGEFLPTHCSFNSIEGKRKDYDRKKHIEALAKAIRDKRINIPPSKVKKLFYVEVMKDLHPDHIGYYAAILSDAIDESLSVSEEPQKTPASIGSNSPRSDL